MKYAREILGLMRPYPGREYRMAQIIREVSRGRAMSPKERNAVREGVRRVLDQLIDSGHVVKIKDREKSAFYVWRGNLPHEVGDICHATCHNMPGTHAP